MRKGRRRENFIPWLIPVTLEHFTAVRDVFKLEQLHLSGGPGFTGVLWQREMLAGIFCCTLFLSPFKIWFGFLNVSL